MVPHRVTPESAHCLRQQVAELWLGVPIGRIGVFHSEIVRLATPVLLKPTKERS